MPGQSQKFGVMLTQRSHMSSLCQQVSSLEVFQVPLQGLFQHSVFMIVNISISASIKVVYKVI